MLQPPKTLTDMKSLFQQAEIRAELLVAYLRLAISLTLGAAFGLSLVGNDVPIDPMLYRQLWYAIATMIGYFALGVLCVLLIRNNRFRSWMVWPSVGADCFFILFNIWLSMVNTGLAGDFIVVLPTLWLIPVVLACGVLRFNPRAQIFIIVTLVVGLIYLDRAMTDLPLIADSAVLDFFFAGPPNVMRLVMIALAGTVLVVATYRTRALFLRTLTEAEGRLNLTRYLPAEVAPELARSGLDALDSGTRQDMAVMFVDMRDFTARSEGLSPDALGLFVTEYRHRIARAVQDHGGIIDKFMGDAAMIVFPAGTDPPETAKRAVSCGQTILAAIADWTAEGGPVSVGIGLHWGEVFAGVIGDRDRLEYSVFGDTVNIAARLESLTKTQGHPMIVSQAVMDMAHADGNMWTQLDPTELRGRTSPLDIYGLVRAA